MNNQNTFHRSLPHIVEENAIYFVTFRLVDSLPKESLGKLREEYETVIKQAKSDFDVNKIKLAYFSKMDDLLDRVVDYALYPFQFDIGTVSAVLHGKEILREFHQQP